MSLVENYLQRRLTMAQTKTHKPYGLIYIKNIK